jgi:hypothetical protein
VIRSSGLLLALAAGAALAQQAWHGPGEPATQAKPAAEKPAAPPVVLGNSPDIQLWKAISAKLTDPEFAAARSQRGRLPPPSFQMPQEQAVREARDRIAKTRQAPAGAAILTIPRAAVAPRLDGAVGEAEWRGALRIALEPAARKASVLLLWHGNDLYLAALAPGDRTDTGFDQFRFWYHLDLSPFFENERAMISGRGDARTLRGVRLPRAGETIRDGMDPKGFQRDTDWGVHGRLRSATAVAGYRQYEAAIDLAEAGIAPEVPFSAYIEIEGDPETDAAGKFKARVTEGQIGSQSQPIWLKLAK